MGDVRVMSSSVSSGSYPLPQVQDTVYKVYYVLRMYATGTERRDRPEEDTVPDTEEGVRESTVSEV